MRLTIRALGLELLDIHVSTEEETADDYDGSGTTSAYPVGFTPSPGDQRWETGVDT